MHLEVIAHEVAEFKTGKEVLQFEQTLLYIKSILTETIEEFSGYIGVIHPEPP